MVLGSLSTQHTGLAVLQYNEGGDGAVRGEETVDLRVPVRGRGRASLDDYSGILGAGLSSKLGFHYSFSFCLNEVQAGKAEVA